MAEAGYDPRAALDLWDLMAAVEADAAARGQSLSLTDRLTLLQTHPTSNTRQEVSFYEHMTVILFAYCERYLMK
jgi:predicted Zn-dependent protease